MTQAIDNAICKDLQKYSPYPILLAGKNFFDLIFWSEKTLAYRTV